MTITPITLRSAGLIFISTLLLAMTVACSNSGGATSSTPPPPPPPPPPTGGGGPTFTPGVFEPSSTFKDRCEVVRTGVDIEGNPFPDMPGSILEENFWLRSWTHETYLFNNEVVDQDPANFNDPLDYFAVLKTMEKTASGKDKDQFHFTQPTDEFLAARNSKPAASYGASYVALSTTPPRDFRILYTEPNSPAAEVISGQANLLRGTKILEVDGVDLVNANTQAAVDILNAGLFPATAGEMHSFVVQDAGSSLQRSIMMTSADLAPKPVNRLKTIDTPSGKVGYILFNTFSPFASEKEIADAITSLKAQSVSDLVLDLRYNGGGLLAVASQLSFMVAGPVPTNGKIFERLQFNADAGNLNPVTGEVNDPVPFFDTGLGFSLPSGTPLDSLNLPRLFILTAGGTCSASEAVINGLRGIDVEVVLIGGTTCGKPFGFFPQDNCGQTYFTIQFRGVNNKGFGDYSDGFIPQNSTASFGVRAPGCAVRDDLTHELGDPNELQLAAALQFRTNGTCPAAPSASAATVQSVAAAGAIPIGVKPSRDVFETNLDMTMPE